MKKIEVKFEYLKKPRWFLPETYITFYVSVFTKFAYYLCQQNMQFLFSESTTWIRKMKEITYFVTNTLQ